MGTRAASAPALIGEPYRVLGQANAQVAYRAGLRGVLHSPVVTYRNISKD